MTKHLYENLIFVSSILHVFDKAKEAIRKAEKIFPDLKYMAFERHMKKLDDGYQREYVVYKGNFKNDSYEGYGLEYDKNGYLKYRGYWKDGRKHGQGTSFDVQGNMTYEGEFYEDKPMTNSANKKQLF